MPRHIKRKPDPNDPTQGYSTGRRQFAQLTAKQQRFAQVFSATSDRQLAWSAAYGPRAYSSRDVVDLLTNSRVQGYVAHLRANASAVTDPVAIMVAVDTLNTLDAAMRTGSDRERLNAAFKILCINGATSDLPRVHVRPDRHRQTIKRIRRSYGGAS
jgi:hypothetical protein